MSDAILKEETLSNLSSRYKTMLRTVQACGDYDRVLQGVFENYLDVKFKDMAFQNVSLFTSCEATFCAFVCLNNCLHSLLCEL